MTDHLIHVDEIIKTKQPKQYDFIIIGAGIFGAAFATTMAKEGREVLLVERDLSEPDRIVGELLQPGGCQALKQLGLEDCLEDIDGIRVDGYVVYFQGKPAHVPYTKDPRFGTQFKGKSFHHGKFVSKLRERAKSTKGVTTIEATVNKLIVSSDETRIMGVYCTKDNASQYYFGSMTVVADGCFSKFRKAVLYSEPETLSQFVGFILKDCPLPYSNHGHVILGKDGPVLLYQIGTHDTRVLIDVPGKLPSRSNGDLHKYLLRVSEDLPAVVKPSFVAAINEQIPRVMPNSKLSPGFKAYSFRGVLIAGDAFNMRHPLTGGGMTVAFNDIVQLQKLFDPRLLPSLEEHHLINLKLEQFQWNRIASSSVINILACALYRLFQSKNDPNLLMLQEGCFEYFRLGGECVDGPVRFLSGVNGSIIALAYHFFRVCLYTQYLEVREAPPLMKPWASLYSMRLFFTGCQVILPLIYTEFQNLLSLRSFCRILFSLFSLSYLSCTCLFLFFGLSLTKLF